MDINSISRARNFKSIPIEQTQAPILTCASVILLTGARVAPFFFLLLKMLPRGELVLLWHLERLDVAGEVAEGAHSLSLVSPDVNLGVGRPDTGSLLFLVTGAPVHG